MRIALITDSIDLGHPSRGRYVQKLVEALLKIKSSNDEVILLHGRNISENIYTQTKHIIVPFLKTNKYTYMKKKIDDVIRTLKINSILNKLNVDVLHIPHLGRSAPSILYLLNKDKTRLVVTNHGMANLSLTPQMCYGSNVSISRKIFDYIEKWEWAYIFRNKIDMLITVSNSEKNIIHNNVKIPLDKINVIYHGVDHNHFRPYTNREKIKEYIYKKYKIDFEFILHVSTYQPKKNVEGIIKSYSLLRKKFDIEEKLVIIGRQPTFLKRWVKQQGLSKDIIFLGYIPYSDLPKFYGVAKIFIFPSFHESFGMPILEAMACGTPVITSNVYAMPEIAGDAAVLVNPYDIFDIASKIYELIINDDMREKLRFAGLKRAKQFTWEKSAKEHLKIYRNIVFN